MAYNRDLKNEKHIKTFQNVYYHLKPVGVFLFDIWYSLAIHYNKNIVEVNYDLIIEEKSNGKITSLTETHPMRHFSLPEIHLLASMTGFQIIESLEWMTEEQPSDKTWGVCFILKRN